MAIAVLLFAPKGVDTATNSRIVHRIIRPLHPGGVRPSERFSECRPCRLCGRAGGESDDRIRGAIMMSLRKFLRNCHSRPKPYKPWGRSYTDAKYGEKRRDLVNVIGDLLLDQQKSPNYDPCAMSRIVGVEERMSGESQFGVMQLGMDLIFHPCDSERIKFHKVAPLYKTTKGGGLPDSLSSVELIEGASKRIFNDSAMRRALGILESTPPQRHRLVVHGGTWRLRVAQVLRAPGIRRR